MLVLLNLLLLIILLFFIRTVIKIYVKLTIGRCTSKVCLVGKTALITGGNAGLGFQTALALAGRGCRIIIASRTNSDKTKEEIIARTGNSNIVTKQFNLDSLNSVRLLAKDINETEERLDILINNAGIIGLGNSYTEDGLHVGMQVNHFGPFLLTHLLIDLIKKSTPSRIIFVSSKLAIFNNLNSRNLNYPRNDLSTSCTVWSNLLVYCNSKLCNIITAKELAAKLDETGVTVNVVHPGMVHTDIFSRFFQHHSVKRIISMLFKNLILNTFSRSPEDGAQTIIHLALSQSVEKVSGKYFADCQIAKEPRKAKNCAFREMVWNESEKLVKLRPEEML